MLDDLLPLPAEPYPAQRPYPDVVLQTLAGPAFQDALLAHPLDVAAWDASAAAHRLVQLLPVRSKGENHTAHHRFHPVLADGDAQKSVCHAACRPMSGPLLRALCKWGAGLSAA